MFLRDNMNVLQAFAELSNKAGARADYVQGGGGNTSAKLKKGLMAIKASGYCLKDIRTDKAYAVLDYLALRGFYTSHEPEEFADVEQAGAAQAKAATKIIDGLGTLRPSVEAGFHSLLNTYVLHSHSVYANLAACAAEAEGILADAFKTAGYAYGFVPYVNPGARLTFAVRDTLRSVSETMGKRPAVLFMQNHGLIVHHDDASVCTALHADANARVAAAFSLKADAFPPVALRPASEGRWLSDTPFLQAQMQTGRYNEDFLLRQPLYPDQLVFLNGTFQFGGVPNHGFCAYDAAAGLVTYHMDYKKALVIEETLTAVVFIVSAIESAGYTLSVMGDAAKEFIANWESEQYRKSLSEKKSE